MVRSDCRPTGEQSLRQCEFELDTLLQAEHARVLELLKGTGSKAAHDHRL